jgi:lysophospholipase L1-like esterase
LELFLQEQGYKSVRVVNAGAGGWTSLESLINFQLRLLDLEPDMIVVYHAINDVHPRLVWPQDAYRGDASGYIGALPGVIMPNILEHSTVYRVLMIRAGLIRSHGDLGYTLFRPASSYYGDEFLMQKIRGTYPDGIFRNVSALEMLKRNRPVFFVRNIENMVTVAKARNIQPVLVTFATSERFHNEPRVSSIEYVGAFEEMNAELKAIAERHGVPVFDMAGVFPKDEAYFTDGRHNTVKGAQLKAKMIADFLIANQLMPGRFRLSERPARNDVNAAR